jgi:hypothetical protein
LKFALKLFTVAVDGRQVIVGQLAPLLFNFAFELLPIPFHTIPVHECFLSCVCCEFQTLDYEERLRIARGLFR